MIRRILFMATPLVGFLFPSMSMADIQGPDTVPVYQLATLQTSVDADGYIWLAFPFDTTFAAHQGDPKVFQFTGAPGRHDVVLIPLKGGKPAGQFRKVVTIGGPLPPPIPPGPEPPIPPGPAPLPPGRFGLAQVAFDAATKAGIPDAVADQLAKGYISCVSQAVALSGTTPQDLVKAVAAKQVEILQGRYPLYTLRPAFEALAKAGKISTLGDHADAFTEAAVGLEAIR